LAGYDKHWQGIVDFLCFFRIKFPENTFFSGIRQQALSRALGQL
jgi:hypothetical protein